MRESSAIAEGGLRRLWQPVRAALEHVLSLRAGIRSVAREHPVAVLAQDGLVLAVVALIPPLFVNLDILVLKNGVGEASLTEFGQEAVLLAVAVGFWRLAWQNRSSRGFSALAGGLTTCMLIRELDAWLCLIVDGLWAWLAALTAVGTVAYVWKQERKTVWGPLREFVGSKPYQWMLFGLVVMVLFSQVFGSGNLVWKHVLLAGYTHLMKTALQEGLELFGYLLFGYGAWSYWRENAQPRGGC